MCYQYHGPMPLGADQNIAALTYYSDDTKKYFSENEIIDVHHYISRI